MTMFLALLLVQPAAPTVTRASVIADADKGFAAADVNRDNRLDRAEVAAELKRQAQQARLGLARQREAEFRALDANRDGRLDLTEFQRPLTRVRINVPPADQALRGLDANRDGVINREENRRPNLQRFDALDKNRDGRLTPAERPRG